ncbi:MAG: hypothetical protein Kow0059_11170 [Candidatus Sumerlaeia bacterium]
MPISVNNGSSSKSSSSARSLGCLIVFLLPFFAVGLFVLSVGLRELIGGARPLKECAAIIGFGTVFTGFAGAFLALGVAGYRRRKQIEDSRRKHPEEPWLWREDWARGRIVSEGRGNVWVIWGFALFWNAISIPAAVFGIPELMHKEKWAVLVILLFPLVGMGLLLWAVYATLQWKKYGVSIFEPTSLPGVVGGRLEGQIQGRVRLRPGERVVIRLSNLRRRTTGSGDNRSTHYDVLWQEEHELPMEQLALAPGGMSVIPVQFVIPRSCEPTSAFGGEDGVIWRLEASAEVPGVNYAALFEVPVFVTAESDAPETQEQIQQTTSEVLTEGPPASLSVHISPTAAGGTQFYWKPARRPIVAFLMTVVTILIGAGLWLSIVKKAPIVAPLVISVFLLVFVLIVITMWTSSSRLVIEGGRVRVLNKWAGLGSWKEFAAGDVAGVFYESGSQVGTQAYYYITLKLQNGETIKLGNGMEPLREARYLAARISKELKSASSPGWSR